MGEQQNLVSFRLGSDDIRSIRFGVSPGYELCEAVGALQQPGSRPLLWGWLREVRGGIPRDAFQLLADLIHPASYFPDFLTSSPWPDMTPDDEVELLRQVKVEQVLLDLGKVMASARGERRERLSRLYADPGSARSRIAEAWMQVWRATLDEHWEQIRRVLTADIAYRSRRMAEVGLGEVIDSLHERVSWQKDGVQVRMRSWSEDVQCDGRGLLLVPTLLGAPFCAVVTEKPVQPTLFYPAQGVTENWHRSGTELDTALVALLGDGRARVLRCLDAPRTTSETAELAALAISTASHHLSVLRDARLIISTRQGSRMLHVRSVLGDALAV